MAVGIESGPSTLTRKKIIDTLRAELDLDRQSFIPHWRDLSSYILPRRSRFCITDVNKGDRRYNNINDNTATLAARTLRSGMMGGVTSPARPWFRLTTPDPELAEFGRVKEWLYQVQQIMTTSFLKSNLYNTLPIVYGDLGTFATAPFSVEEDLTGDVLHTNSFPVGSYMIAKNDKGQVDTFMRDYRMTVGNLVKKFGRKDKDGKIDWSNFSLYVRSQFERGNYNTWIDVCHVIMPNDLYDPSKLFSKYKKFMSVYYELGSQGASKSLAVAEDNHVFLKESGYDYFPILCPRWEVTGEDVYGTSCPGMEVLGDTKQLQLGEKRIFEAVEKIIRPPMTGPSSMRNNASSILPGDMTYADTPEGRGGYRPVFQVDFRINEMEAKQSQTRQRIQRGYYEDLFLMLANSDRRQITAREIDERHEEKLLALGPVLEQLNQDALDPLIDINFNIHLRQRLLPPPPEELAGMDLKVEYISIMAQAQKLLGIGSIERFVQFGTQVAGIDPSALDKIKTDQLLDVYADMTSVPPSVVRTDEEVDALRAARAEAQQKQAQVEQAAMGAQTAKTLSETNTEGQNALTNLINQAQAGG